MHPTDCSRLIYSEGIVGFVECRLDVLGMFHCFALLLQFLLFSLREFGTLQFFILELQEVLILAVALYVFLHLLEQTYHQKPLIYTGRNFYNQYLKGKIDDYRIMIALYTDEEPILADGRDVTMWQYTGKGRIVGVNGYVDKSRFMGRHGLREIRYRH
jgi:hypothetical protein